jgi:uncharacterized protein (DUF1501 family)
MDIWESADPKGKVREGWLGRYFADLAPQTGRVFAGLTVGDRVPGEMYTPAVAIPAVSSVQTYRLQGGSGTSRTDKALLQAVLGLYAAAPRATPFGALLGSTLEAAHQSSLALQQAHAAYVPAATYPQTPFAQGLRLLAEAIVQDLGVRVGHVSLGGFDTHADQRAGHVRLLQTVAQGLAAFSQDLKAHGKDGEVLIMTWSEFGRRVKANASQGTDHGAAAPLFLLGAAVKGGLYGERPNLGKLDFGNLRYTTDFRSVYKTVLDRWLQAPADVVLGERGLPGLPFLG